MNTTQALRQCVELIKLVKFVDCAESPELWHQHGLVLSNAERVLRDGEKQEPVAWMTDDGRVATDETKRTGMASTSRANFNIPLYTHPAPSLQAVVEVPEGWQLVPIKLTPEMVEAGANCDPERESPWAAYLAAAPQPPAAPSGDVVCGAALTNEQVSKVARYLSDFSSGQCNVDKDDAWKIYGDDEIALLRAALADVGVTVNGE